MKTRIFLVIISLFSQFSFSAYNSDGSADYVTYPNAAKPFGWGDDFCVMGWFKTSSTSADLRTFIESRSTGIKMPFELLVNTSHKFQAGNYNGIGSVNQASTASVNDGIWHHGAMSHDGGAKKFLVYLDGAQVGSLTSDYAGADFANTEDGRIGSDSALSRHFPGSISDVRIYARECTEKEIRMVYLSNGRYISTDSLNLWIPLSDGANGETVSGTIVDRSENNRDGTAVGNASWIGSKSPFER